MTPFSPSSWDHCRHCSQFIVPLSARIRRVHVLACFVTATRGGTQSPLYAEPALAEGALAKDQQRQSMQWYQ